MVSGIRTDSPTGTELGCSWDRAGMQLGLSWDPAGTLLGLRAIYTGLPHHLEELE